MKKIRSIFFWDYRVKHLHEKHSSLYIKPHHNSSPQGEDEITEISEVCSLSLRRGLGWDFVWTRLRWRSCVTIKNNLHHKPQFCLFGERQFQRITFFLYEWEYVSRKIEKFSIDQRRTSFYEDFFPSYLYWLYLYFFLKFFKIIFAHRICDDTAKGNIFASGTFECAAYIHIF